MAPKYPVVFASQPSAGQLPLEQLETGDQLIDPATGQPYLSVPGSGRLLWGPAPPSDPLETYATGDACFNEDPATNKSVAGWVCTTGGVGGVAVWTPFYVVYGTPADKQVVSWDSVGGKAKWAEGSGGGDVAVLDEYEEDETRGLVAAALDTASARLDDEVGKLNEKFRRQPACVCDPQPQIDAAIDLVSARLYDAVSKINEEFKKQPACLCDPQDIAAAVDLVSARLYDETGKLDEKFKQQIAEVPDPQPQIDAAVDLVSDRFYDAVAKLNQRFNQQIAQVVDPQPQIDAAVDLVSARLDDEVGKITKKFNEQIAFVMDVQSEIDEAVIEANAALASEVAVLNERIGNKYQVTTLDATPTILATITPSPFKAVRLFGKLVAHRTDRLEAAIYNFLTLARAVPASGVFTIAALPPTPGETVTIDGVTYTWQNALVLANDVKIGGTVSASLDNLIKAINLTGIAGTDYGVGTTKHPTVSAVKASANTMEAVAQTPGLAGNLIATPVPGMVDGAWGAATLALGLDMALFGSVITTEYEDDAAWAVSLAVSGSGLSVDVVVTGVLDTPIKWSAEITALELF